MDLFSRDERWESNDPGSPREVEGVPVADLLAHWAGIAVVVSQPSPQTGGSIANLIQAKFESVFWFLIASLCVVTGLPFFNRTNLGTWQVACAILICSIGFAAFHHSVAPTGFFNNPRAVDHVASDYRVPQDNFPAIAYGELKKGIESKLFNLLDARIPSAFAENHIEGASNFPVDASLGEFADVINNIDPELPIVVYCQGINCQWDQLVADRLHRLGFRDIRLYEEGWQEYQYLTERAARK